MYVPQLYHSICNNNIAAKCSPQYTFSTLSRYLIRESCLLLGVHKEGIGQGGGLHNDLWHREENVLQLQEGEANFEDAHG